MDAMTVKTLRDALEGYADDLIVATTCCQSGDATHDLESVRAVMRSQGRRGERPQRRVVLWTADAHRSVFYASGEDD